MISPPMWRERVLTMLHDGHPGIARMKNFARSYICLVAKDR